MTAIIGVKRGKKAFLVSDGLTSAGEYIYEINDPRHSKVTRVLGSPSCFIGLSGSVKAINSIKFFDGLLDFKKDITYTYLVKKFVPWLFKYQDDLQLLEKNDNKKVLGCAMIIMTPTKMFTIYQDGTVIDNERLAIIGSGSLQLESTYYTISNKVDDPKELAFKSMINTIEKGIGIGYPITIAGNDGSFEILSNNAIEDIDDKLCNDVETYLVNNKHKEIIDVVKEFKIGYKEANDIINILKKKGTIN